MYGDVEGKESGRKLIELIPRTYISLNTKRLEKKFDDNFITIPGEIE